MHQESLGGNAKTSLVIAVANALQHVDETLQSLQFGSRAMRVHTQASQLTSPYTLPNKSQVFPADLHRHIFHQNLSRRSSMSQVPDLLA